MSLGTTQRLHLLLCLAENAIGPGAFRNDDILRLLSGKTVEINNTDVGSFFLSFLSVCLSVCLSFFLPQNSR